MKNPAGFWEVFRETWRLSLIEGFIGIVLLVLEDRDAHLSHVITRLRGLADSLEQRYLTDTELAIASSPPFSPEKSVSDQEQEQPG